MSRMKSAILLQKLSYIRLCHTQVLQKKVLLIIDILLMIAIMLNDYLIVLKHAFDTSAPQSLVGDILQACRFYKLKGGEITISAGAQEMPG